LICPQGILGPGIAPYFYLASLLGSSQNSKPLKARQSEQPTPCEFWNPDNNGQVQSLICLYRVYTASFAFFEAIWEAGITHCFVNLGSDHPSIIEAIVKGQNEKKGQFPRIITCPNEVRDFIASILECFG
jgi:hypothetical protein